MRRILVTGASGFIGRRLVPRIRAQFPDDEVACLVHATNSAHEEIGRRVLDSHGISYRAVELLDPSTLSGLLGFTHIIHLAATTDTDAADFSANDAGTANLLTALAPLNSGVHIIFPGSSAVYAGRDDVMRPVSAKTSVQPTHAYARSKLRAETILTTTAEDQGFRLTIARLNTVYGPVPRVNSLLDVLGSQVKKRSILTRLNWPGRSSVIHVDDVCRRFLKLLAETPPTNGIYVFSSEALTLADMYRALYDIFNMTYREIRLPIVAWHVLAFCLRMSRYLELVMPARFYTLLWRANLVTSDVLYCEANDVGLKDGTPDRKFVEAIREIFV